MGNPTVPQRSRQSLKFAHTYRRLASPADHERSLRQPVLNAGDLRSLSNEAQSQQGVVSSRGGKAFVDYPAERLNAGAPQVLLKSSGLGNRSCLRQGHQDHPCVGGVLQPHQRGNDTPRSARFELGCHLAMIGAGRIQQE